MSLAPKRTDMSEARHKEALVRAEARTLRGPKGQVETLDTRLGKDVGAARERARLSRVLGKKS
jgi:hypothetical protein